MALARSLRWSHHWRIGRRHFGLALYRLDGEEQLWLDRYYIHFWSQRL